MAYAVPIALGVSSLLGSLFASGADSRARRQQAALESARLREDARANALNAILQRKLLQLQTAPVRNARGDVTRYIPGRGFETVPTPLTRNTELAGTQAVREQLTGGRVAARGEESLARRRRLEAGAAASALLPALIARALPTDAQVQGAEGRARVEALQRGQQGVTDVGRAVARQLNRSGAQPGNALERIARARREQLAVGGAGGAARTAVRNANAQDAQTLGSVYNTLVGRGVPGAYQPTIVNPTASLEQTLAQRLNTLPQAFGVAGALSPKASNTPQVTPNFGPANLFTGIGDVLGGILAYQQAQKQREGEYGKRGLGGSYGGNIP